MMMCVNLREASETAALTPKVKHPIVTDPLPDRYETVTFALRTLSLACSFPMSPECRAIPTR